VRAGLALVLFRALGADKNSQLCNVHLHGKGRKPLSKWRILNEVWRKTIVARKGGLDNAKRYCTTPEDDMRGLMMDVPLSITSLIQYSAAYHGEVEIVSRTVEGPIHRYTYHDVYRRAQQLAHGLKQLGVENGDRVATVAWNGYRHLELYFGISGTGAVCHTVNPRLSPEQITYIVNHAQDKVIFLDLTFVPLLESLCEQLPSVTSYVIMTDMEHMPVTTLPRVLCYEALLADQPEHFAWPELPEETASSLCYTSGTTGHPKGTLFTHRSTVLHAFAGCFPDNFAFSSHDSVLPIVPMYHVNAWGLPYACAMVGAKLVFPGPKMDSENLYELLDREKVTFAGGVPTIWAMLLDYVRRTGKKLPHLKRVTIGGAAVPPSMMLALEDEFGVEVRQGWGMTEMSPVGTMGSIKGSQLALSRQEQLRYKLTQGRPIYGVAMRIVDTSGKELPHDGESSGQLCVRGPWVLSEYYHNKQETEASFDNEGWFHTGDIATIDAEGYLRIVDRSKDVIKSGGEWISSIEIENAAVGHPDVAEAAVIASPHPKWGERPLLVVVAKEGAQPSREQILDYLKARLHKLALPDDVVFTTAIPHTATGKILKTKLREIYKSYTLPTA
jgi:acyl-CoA synthetase (AMP-forming)/AMP-acid ligase II